MEWTAIADGKSETEYEKTKATHVKWIRKQRSLRENLECKQRDRDEMAEIRVLKYGRRAEQKKREKERERRRRDLNFQQKG